MANANDLRYVKTERLLEETYVRLKQKTRAPVKVSELCQAAMINKTTFYAHYETMDALHEHICTREIEAMLDACPHVGEAFTDTAAFVRSLVEIIREHASMARILFGDDATKQTNVFEACLRRRYLHGDESPEMEMKLIFAIGGAARLLIGDLSEERIRMTIRLIARVLDA